MNTVWTWPELETRLFEEADIYLEVRGDRLHTRIARQWALALLEQEGGDRRVVEPAVILHDVGWSAVDPVKISAAFGVRADGKAEAREVNRIHEIEGASIARRILESLGYDERLTRRIVRIIERHDSTMEAGSLEERLVKDADKLWRYSGTGFWTEIERQEVDPRSYHRRLTLRRREWFLTRTAFRMAGEELQCRGRELEKRAPGQHRDSG
ncbi:MAG: HD domain-containing protein [Deltaproteobacteria bacterium]|nr:HD domain-containing protein [Deltaproteobacteria bacterium]